ncbi:MAG: MBL fold metallo-hydrolase [Candidatus Algichlamydia australiensis]|nr:MBL fold metallo-hydrolase [Chlamydiales bacterium]
MARFCPLASGSKGNLLFFESDDAKILIDCGLSGRQTVKLLAEIGVDLSEIDAILITHEHIDHIRGIERICKEWNTPLFANSETARAICSNLSFRPAFQIFSTGETFHFKDLAIHPFTIHHDTLDPVAFTIQMRDQKIGICADLGFATTLVRAQLQNCNLLYIESNHDPDMVHASPRPMNYKQRVLGRQGHLSNQSCQELLAEVRHPNLKRVYLAHLSEECNHPEKALQSACASYDGDLLIAHQRQISDQYVF